MSSTSGTNGKMTYLQAIEEIPENLAVTNYSTLADFFEKIAFDGFEPAEMIYLLITGIPGCVFESKKLDMLHLCGIVVDRGTNLSKIMSNCKPEGRGMLERFRIHYSIMDNLANGKGKNVITLSRIAICFPWLTCEIAAKRSTPIVDMSVIGETTDIQFPRYMITPAFASMIPNLTADESLPILCCYL